MDLNQLMQVASNPQTRQMLQALLQQFSQGRPAQGAQGLMNQLQQAGLSSQVQSWMSTGPSQPVTGQQMKQALGPNIDQAAAAAGMAPDEAAGDLAEVVPAVVNEASPNGQLDMSALQDIMKQLTGAGAG